MLRATFAGAVVLGIGGGLAGCTTPAKPGAAAASTDNIKRGGSLRVGVSGGSAKDTLDAHRGGFNPDTARAMQLYDRLMRFTPDFMLEPELAESFEPNSRADEWTVRLRKGVTFHDGAPLTADDVIFTIKRILDPKDPKVGASGISYLDVAKMQKVDDLTIKLPLTVRNVGFAEQFAQYFMGVVPVGYDPAKPVGTGPFKFKSFTPGQQSVFTRNDNYWRDNEPYVDEVVIIDFPDDTARVNALLGGQVDAIANLPQNQIAAVQGNPALAVLNAPTGAWLAFTMRVDAAPFDDVRVRQAMRLLTNRQDVITQALNGQATLGNDLYGRYDAAYASDLAQREQDIDQAKSLLKQAGRSDLQAELVTAPSFQGMVEGAGVLAQNATEAGVDLKIRKVDGGTLYGDNWLKWPLAADYWVSRSYLSQAALSSLPSSPWNETHWNDPTYIKLVQEAQGQPDDDKRTELLQAAQKIEYDQGGYIIPAFTNQTDAYVAKLAGFEKSKTGTALNNFTLRSVGFVA
ncbi:ABC transporter substrate-binding protein [Nocardioides mesophilus]|uniref:ABC transporter substrate-binding protein n=2 Tax=Nocardioides mesophilus TaxID=433659 RepID=A0A7G9RHR4_9ACTN|nr:ABC transporter substrate-binding protein [Nocardioides mesophilus]